MEDNKFGLGYLPEWDANLKKEYRRRVSIERVFYVLKQRYSLKTNMSHSVKGLLVQIYSTLLAYQLKIKNILSFSII